MIIRDYKKFPFDEVRKMPVAKCKRGQRKAKNVVKDGKSIKTKIDRVNAIAAFDIETTKIPGEEHSVMFIWQFHFMNLDTGDNYTVLGRKWEEFIAFLHKLEYALEGKTLLIFDHNFNYEFSYIKSLIQFTNCYGFTEIFSKDPHHPVYAYSNFGAFEWRDSYALFNSKLEEATKGLPHAKLDGDDFDYTKKRFSWTPLTELEESYCINDVWGLCEAVKRAMDEHGDTVYSIPLTATGYVRRDIKRLMYQHTRFNDYPSDDYPTYAKLRAAYRGGNTHANRWYAGYKLAVENDLAVSSFDRSSSYPDVIVNDMFPIAMLKPEKDMTVSRMAELEATGYAYIVTLMLNDIKLKSECEPDPYLATDKVEFPIGIKREDNGRIMECRRCVITCTDVDWKIIRKQYDFEIGSISYLASSKYGYLPDEFRNYVKQLYVNKTSLKNVAGSEDTYRTSKAKINACYGMMVQRVENTDVIFNEETNELEYSTEKKDPIDNYYSLSHYRPLPYRWGVWVSAWARYHLQSLIDLVGVDMVYTDTDSVKFIGDHEEEIKEFNKFFIDRSTASGACAKDPKGNMHYMGEYENEGTYDQFKTMGAKKYAYTAWEENKKTKELEYNTHITISGVPKEDGAKELVKMGGLDAFKPGTIFSAGKLRPKYNDEDDYGTREVYDCYGNKGVVKITSNACLLDTTYQLGYGKTYKELLDSLPDMLEHHEEIMNAYQFFIDRGYTS